MLKTDVNREPHYTLGNDNLIAVLHDYFTRKNVEEVMLFGSFARGTESKRSDLDLIIIQETPERFFDRYREFYDVYDLVDPSVDMLIYTPHEWSEIRTRRFFVTILKEARTIYVKRKSTG